jgi:hypothetical protein
MRTKGECSGRTEYIIGEKSEMNKEVAWAVYEGSESIGYAHRKPVAWFKHHADAVAFIKLAAQTPQDSDANK